MPDVPEHTDSAARRAWSGWRAWRRSRPFWGGVLLAAAGAELLLIPLPMHSMGLILHIGTGGVLGILIGALLIVCALLIWFNPGQRMFYSIVGVLVSIAALIATNLGGFLLGTLLGVLGGSLAFAWTPAPGGAEQPAPWRRRRGRPAGRHDASLTGLSLVLGDPGSRPSASQHDDAGPGTDAEAGITEPDAADTERGRGGGTRYRGLPLLPLVLGLVAGVLHAGSPAGPGACRAAAAPAVTARPNPTAAPRPAPSPTPSSSCPSPSPSPSTSGPARPAPPGGPRPRPTTSTSPKPGPTGKITKKVAAPGGLVVAAVPSGIAANTATLTGLSYDGVASVPTASGPQQMLKFSMSGLDLSGDDDLTVTEGGHTLSIKASSLNFTGNVTLLCTRIHGDLLGIPLTFTPHRPPPVVLPEMVFTHVTTYQPYTSADSLQIGGLQIGAG